MLEGPELRYQGGHIKEVAQSCGVWAPVRHPSHHGGLARPPHLAWRQLMPCSHGLHRARHSGVACVLVHETGAAASAAARAWPRRARDSLVHVAGPAAADAANRADSVFGAVPYVPHLHAVVAAVVVTSGGSSKAARARRNSRLPSKAHTCGLEFLSPCLLQLAAAAHGRTGTFAGQLCILAQPQPPQNLCGMFGRSCVGEGSA